MTINELAEIREHLSNGAGGVLPESSATVSNKTVMRLVAALESAAEIAANHQHEPDDFMCCGQNCGIIISAEICDSLKD